MSFDFFDTPPPPPTKQSDLEQVLKQFDDHSLQFDQFDPVDNHPPEKSFNSDFFAQHKPSEKLQSDKSKGKSDSFDFQNSRNIGAISYQNGQSFRYQQSPPTAPLRPNERYNKLQQMLSQAKKNNLDMFYRNIDQQNTYKIQEKFNTKEEFDNYRLQLKNYKRQREDAFKESNRNSQFKNDPFYISEKSGEGHNIRQSAQSAQNFKKKDSQRQVSAPVNTPADKFLPQEYQIDQDYNFMELAPEEIKKEVDKQEKKQYQKEAEWFFNQQANARKGKQKNPGKLSQIRQQRPNLFQLTHEQQKMTQLISNYQQMKQNFNDLMSNLKQTNTDQYKIINELKHLKLEYQNKQSRHKIQAENKHHKRQAREKQKEQKEKKLIQIREQMSKAREGSQKDLLYLKINQKIQNLQHIVKNAITEMHQEQQQKFIPKIINYYQQSTPNLSHHSQLGLSREEVHEEENLEHMIEEQLAPVRNAIKELKEQKRQQPALYHLDEFSSPLQLDLTTQQFPLSLSRNRSQQLQLPFVPPEGAKQHIPNSLDTANKYLRRCLIQKSSIIYQSFQFYITSKFTITGNERYPVLCEVRAANKCAVSLYDVFVVVFGPQAQENQLQMRPPKIMHDEFKQNTSFLFEIDLSKFCLEHGGFSIMISYKTDSVNKKKVVFKVVLPFIQLLRPEFIYEQQFVSGWNHMSNQLFIAPQTLDFKNIRSHEDLKLILPFIEISDNDPNSFSYGIMFHHPTSQSLFMIKITCYVSGKASIHLKSSGGDKDKKLKEEILDTMNFLCFG